MIKKEYAIALDEHDNCVAIYKCKMLEQSEVDELKKQATRHSLKVKSEKNELKKRIEDLESLVQTLLHEIKVLKGEEE